MCNALTILAVVISCGSAAAAFKFELSSRPLPPPRSIARTHRFLRDQATIRMRDYWRDDYKLGSNPCINNTRWHPESTAHFGFRKEKSYASAWAVRSILCPDGNVQKIIIRHARAFYYVQMEMYKIKLSYATLWWLHWFGYNSCRCKNPKYLSYRLVLHVCIKQTPATKRSTANQKIATFMTLKKCFEGDEHLPRFYKYAQALHETATKI